MNQLGDLHLFPARWFLQLWHRYRYLSSDSPMYDLARSQSDEFPLPSILADVDETELALWLSRSQGRDNHRWIECQISALTVSSSLSHKDEFLIDDNSNKPCWHQSKSVKILWLYGIKQSKKHQHRKISLHVVARGAFMNGYRHILVDIVSLPANFHVNRYRPRPSFWRSDVWKFSLSETIETSFWHAFARLMRNVRPSNVI